MKNYIILDTEAAPTADCPRDNKAHAECANVYDLGYIIVTDNETIERSFIITDTFFNHNMMKNAYYAEKLENYRRNMYQSWQPVSMLEAWQQFCKDCKDYNVKDVWAYSVAYDKTALNRTIKDASNGFRSFFLPYNVKVKDIWTYAGETICNTKKFVKWCKNNGYITEKGNPITNAETVYRYITGNNEFIEDHTALSDCRIELEILRKVQKRKQKQPTKCGNGWRAASKIAKEM